jgi:hypothetical protein
VGRAVHEEDRDLVAVLLDDGPAVRVESREWNVHPFHAA